jgi:hypothetical protein
MARRVPKPAHPPSDPDHRPGGPTKPSPRAPADPVHPDDGAARATAAVAAAVRRQLAAPGSVSPAEQRRLILTERAAQLPPAPVAAHTETTPGPR